MKKHMVLTLCAILAGRVMAADMADWQWRMAITFDGYPAERETLTNSPALVVLEDGVNGVDFSEFKEDGSDLRFTDEEEENELNYEIEKWDAGSGKAWIWVQVPELATNATIIAYWGNPNALASECTTNGVVWSEGFAGVWHMNQVNALDSTANNLHAVANGPVTIVDGQIGSSVKFNAQNTWLNVVNRSALEPAEVTFSAWVKVNGQGTHQDGSYILSKGRDGGIGNHSYVLSYHYNNNKLFAAMSQGNYTALYDTATADKDNFVYVVGSYRNGSFKFYRNGVLANSSIVNGAIRYDMSNRDLHIGDWGYTGWPRRFDGLIDEVRISGVVRSDDWIWAEWRNMSAPAEFATFGGVEASNPDLPRIKNLEMVELADTSVKLVGEFMTNGLDQATVRLFYGPVDGGTNTATWLTGGGTSVVAGTFADGAILTNKLDGLASGAVYYWNYCASNSAGLAWGSKKTSPRFKTISLPVVTNSAVTGIRSFKATFEGALTDGSLADVEVLVGTIDGEWERSVTVGEIGEESFSVVLDGFDDYTTYYVTCRATNASGVTTATPSLQFTTRNNKTVISGNGTGYVDIGTPDVLQIPGKHALTIEGWVKLKNVSGTQMIYSKGYARSSPYSYMFGIRDNGTKMSAYTGAGGSPANQWRDVTISPALQANRWYHLAFSYDGTNLTCCLNGVSLGSISYSFANYATHSVKIGGYVNTSDINGFTSDVRVWDYARSGNEIRRDMERRLDGDEAGLLGYWPLNDGVGTIAHDATSNGSDGALAGVVWATDDDLLLAPYYTDFLYAKDFSIRDLVTASTRFTNSNKVNVAGVAVPDGYNFFQVGFTGTTGEIDPNGWQITNALPSQIIFGQPQGNTNLTAYIWFTNTSQSVELRRAFAGIHYTKERPVADAWPNLTRVIAPPSPATIPPNLVDRSSTGGVSGGREMDIWARRLNLLSGPDTNATPGEAWITVSSQGVYQVELEAINEAGNVATSAVCVVTVVGINPATQTFYVDKNWPGAELGTAAAPFRTIRAAVEAANQTTKEPNTIRIAAGWYGDGANGGTEDYRNSGAPEGGIYVTRRTEFYGGYAGWQGGESFDWETRVSRGTVIDLDKAGSRAFHIDRNIGQITGVFDGLTFCNASHSAKGGAIYSYSTHYGSTIINNCLFTNNVTTDEGGAAYLWVAFSANYIKFSDFYGNKGKNGGAVYEGNNAMRLVVEDSTFSNNTASAKGGAIYFDGANGPQQNVRRCRFAANTAGTMGGALYSIDPTVIVEQSVFNGNSAPLGAAIGGNDYWCGSLIIANSLVANNSGGYALQVEGARTYGGYSISMVHCTVVNNSGGGLRFQRTDSTTPGRVVNSIIANNGAYGIYRVRNDYTLANNNVFNNGSGDYYNCEPDEASLSTDPFFFDAQNGNYRLAISSLCIDAGTNMGVTVDLDGAGRPSRYGYDIGCYEERALPVIVNRTPIAAGTSALARAEFVYKDPNTPTWAYFVLDVADRGIDSIDDWARSGAAGEQQQGVPFGALLGSLQPETTYWYRCIASNDYDMVWGEAARFRTAAAGGTIRLWSGKGGNALASNAGNWEGGVLPGASDYVVFANTNTPVIWDGGVNGLTDKVGRWTQLENFTGTVTFNTVYPGQGAFTNFTIAGDAIVDNGTWTHLQNTASQIYRLSISVGHDLFLNATTKITAANLGYLNAGPGRQPVVGGSSWGAAAHGGRGGEQGLNWGSSNVYGSVQMPVDLGSGGSNPSVRGGGAIVLNVAGLFDCRGNIDVNAGSVNGAAGSILIHAGELAGKGTIQASNPTSGSYASGGGGRIAVYLTHPGALFADFAGTVRANTMHDGAARRGAAGTVYISGAADTPGGLLRIDNAAQAAYFYTELPIDDGLGRGVSIVVSPTGKLRLRRNHVVRDLTLGAGARLDLAGQQVTVSKGLTIGAATDFKPGIYAAADFGDEVQDSSEGSIGRIIIPAPGTVLMLR